MRTVLIKSVNPGGGGGGSAILVTGLRVLGRNEEEKNKVNVDKESGKKVIVVKLIKA